MDAPETTEDPLATLLNGAMISLLGAAFPCLTIWMLALHWREWTSGHSWMTTSQAIQGFFVLGFSLLILRPGLRLIRQGVAGLWKR